MICRRAILLAPLVLSLIALGQADSLQRGLDLFRQEKYEAALQQFEEARRLQPGNASIDNFIGITETKLGRIDEANKDYETAIRIAPKLAGPHTNLGFNYLSKKQYELAEKQLRMALALDSADPFTHYYLAVLYLTTARGKDALPHIEPAITLLENDPPAAVLAIKACLTSDAPAEALKVIDLLEQHSRFSAEQEYELAKSLDGRQMYVESAARFRRIALGHLSNVADAEDAVQEAWLRLTGVDARQVDNLDAWLTTAVARICLNTLRSRRARPPEELVAHVPDPIVEAVGDVDPEHQAMLADAVGMALFVILDTLAPAERLAFVLHDVFAVPFDQIAAIVERTP